MPIRADLRKFYGRVWRTVTRPRILGRAGNCCERCGKPNRTDVETWSAASDTSAGRKYEMYWRIPAGLMPGCIWIDRTGTPAPTFRPDAAGWFHRFSTRGPWDPERRIHVVLTIAHLNHQAGDDRDENLQALCQWCHLIHDRGHHFESRATRKDEGRPLLQASTPAGAGDAAARS